MIALLRDLAPALAIIVTITLAAWRLGRRFGGLVEQVRALRAVADELVKAIKHLDARLQILEQRTADIPRRTHGARSQDPRHPEAP